jgi:hypothetical protein
MTLPPNVSAESQQRSHKARHLAAHAIVALRAGFHVEHIELNTTSTAQSGVTCDWKQSRASYNDDEKLIHRSFAMVFIGGIVDQEKFQSLPDELQGEMKADMTAAEDCRETAVAWNLAESVQETNPFARVGYKLASRLLKKDRALIDDLATHLAERESLDEASLQTWFQKHASRYSLDELETTNTY